MLSLQRRQKLLLFSTQCSPISLRAMLCCKVPKHRPLVFMIKSSIRKKTRAQHCWNDADKENRSTRSKACLSASLSTFIPLRCVQHRLIRVLMLSSSWYSKWALSKRHSHQNSVLSPNYRYTRGIRRGAKNSSSENVSCYKIFRNTSPRN
jgi:hypothetical protein